MHIIVKVGALPGKIQEIALNGERSAAVAIATAELNAEGYEIRVNGELADGDIELSDGDVVLLVKKIKGN